MPVGILWIASRQDRKSLSGDHWNMLDPVKRRLSPTNFRIGKCLIDAKS